jgi:hypothetical protein
MPGDEVALTVTRSIIIGLLTTLALTLVLLSGVLLVVVLFVDDATGALGTAFTACTGVGATTAAVSARGAVWWTPKIDKIAATIADRIDHFTQ